MEGLTPPLTIPCLVEIVPVLLVEHFVKYIHLFSRPLPFILGIHPFLRSVLEH